MSGFRTPAVLGLAAAGLTVLAIATGSPGCSGSGGTRAEQSSAPSPPQPLLPQPPAQFAPAHTRVADGSSLTGEKLARIDTCARCHAEAYRQWSGSAHSFASFNNPVYRVSIDGFRARLEPEKSRFCAGCHDVALLLDGAMDQAVQPEDVRAHVGVNCRVCHGVESVQADGNGSFELRGKPISLPSDGDEASVERHRQSVSVRALGSDLCRSCHRSFLGPGTGNEHHLVGMDDFSDWQGSAHAGQGTGRVDDPVEARDCIDCHMPREAAGADERAGDGEIASHRFLGGHTWLATMRQDEMQLRRVQDQLRGVASIDIAAAISRPPEAEDGSWTQETRTLPADGAPVLAGGELLLDVVVRNLSVGHRFPGGVRDAQDVWLEVTLRDEAGALVAQSGLAHSDDTDDTEAHVLRAHVADAEGKLLLERQVDEFRASIFDHTIAPRDAAVVRYSWLVPTQARGPVRATARLLHRSRNLRLQERACQSAQSQQGQAFARASESHRGQALQPCLEQPITVIATVAIDLATQEANGAGGQDGAGEAAAQRRPDWRRLYEHGMAWTHAVQERLDEARPSLMRALELLEARQAPAHEQAMVLTALGRLAGRQGRTDEALSWLAKAEQAAPGHPAIDAARGAALMRVWRWQEAEAPLSAVTQRAPENTGAWAALAVTLGSLGKDLEALTAARQGLVVEPRHAALLRVQALSLRALGQPAEPALDAYDHFRKPDRVMDIRFACAARSVACAREREPVHVHDLLAPVGASPE